MDRCAIDLDALTIGARVAWLDYGMRPTAATIGAVSRFTATQIVVTSTRGSTYRFRRRDGALIGNLFTYLIDVCDERVIQARAHWRVIGTVRDIETVVRSIRIGGKLDTDAVRMQLERIQHLAEQGLTDLLIS